ncbi:MAG TPA: M1 family aminopeptidase [Pyrinomonadaceae bacterium]|nr:M1 family aminopeptidase [Pyrinomonadaceae bacterium]
MSTTLQKFSLVPTIFLLNLFFFLSAQAQDIEAQIKFLSLKPPTAVVSGKFLNGKRSNSFLQTYADAENLDARIENPEFSETDFSYRIKLSVPKNLSAAAHVSWLAETHGLIMLNDLLPQFSQKTSAKIIFELPADWRISTNEKEIRDKIFSVENIETAVFLIGKGWRENQISVDKTAIDFAVSGNWEFTDAEATKMSAEILAEYLKIFGEIPTQKINVFLLPFPQNAGFDRWRAETRGANVTILSSPTTFKHQSAQRLHEQLRHEIFHLWIPNGVNLSGDYAWFYEGFTHYAALRVGVELNRISFNDFLNTLNQAVFLTERRSQPLSLIEASKNRWNGENSSVYAKGLAVAFLIDVALLRSGSGDILKVFREVFQKHRLSKNAENGNAAVLNILKSNKELIPIIENYIRGAEKINWETDLQASGIEVIRENSGTQLKIKEKAKGREGDLLNKLGYNNWRKLLKNSK